MRLLALAPVVVVAALPAGTAAADPVPLPPLPTVPTVPVSVPSVPLPVPAPAPAPVLPKLPQPALPEPVATATRSSSSSAPAPVGAAVAEVSGSPSGGGGSSAPAGSGWSAAPSSSSTRVDHFHSSRPWIGTTGAKQRRTTTFTFVLQQAGRVVFTVDQVSPVCVGIGRFTVGGHAGLNRVRFAGVVRGRRLVPGTYRISIRTNSGRVVRRVTLVVVGGSAPSGAELRALRSANTCKGGGGPAAGPASTSTTSAGMNPLASRRVPPLPAASQLTAAAGLAPHGPNLHSGVLASSVERTARVIRPLLVALLAFAILLLGVASLPSEAVPEARMHDLLARHRVELAGLGAATLVAVAVAFLLG
jgi:hypothetical protein